MWCLTSVLRISGAEVGDIEGFKGGPGVQLRLAKAVCSVAKQRRQQGALPAEGVGG